MGLICVRVLIDNYQVYDNGFLAKTLIIYRYGELGVPKLNELCENILPGRPKNACGSGRKQLQLTWLAELMHD